MAQDNTRPGGSPDAPGTDDPPSDPVLPAEPTGLPAAARTSVGLTPGQRLAAKQAQKAGAEVIGLRYRVESLPRYDARVTRYDRAAGAEGFDDADNRKGGLHLRVLEPITDEQWQDVLNRSWQRSSEPR
jgi:hypothetical protein